MRKLSALLCVVLIFCMLAVPGAAAAQVRHIDFSLSEYAVARGDSLSVNIATVPNAWITVQLTDDSNNIVFIDAKRSSADGSFVYDDLLIADEYPLPLNLAIGFGSTMHEARLIQGEVFIVAVNGSHDPQSGAGSYAPGAGVTIRAGSRSGFNFNGWTAVGVTLASPGSATATFTMPTNDVTVTAQWAQISAPPGGNGTGGGTGGGGGGGGGGVGTAVPPAPAAPGETAAPGEAIDVPSDGAPLARPAVPPPALAAPALGGEAGYISGYPDGTFRPNSGITRFEAASMLHGLVTNADKDMFGNEAARFSDTEAGQWYSNAVGYLAAAGILSGYPDGTFRGGAQMTRAEFATVITKAMALGPGGDVSFSDLPGDHWAYGYIASAYNSGWVKGYPDGAFMPDSNITRAEAVALLNRVVGLDVRPSAEASPFSDVFGDEWFFDDIMAAKR